MQRLIITLIIAPIFTSCVSSSNLFQDGKTAGKKETMNTMSVSYNIVPLILPDSATHKINYKPYKLPAPWFEFSGQYGLAERIDVGGGFGLGMLSFGLHCQAKVALLPNDLPFNLSLFGSARATINTTNDNIDYDDVEVFNYSYLVALPMSYSFSKEYAIVLQPIWNWESYNYKVTDDLLYKGKLHLSQYKLGMGVVRSFPRKKGALHYNVAICQDPLWDKLYPTLGVAMLLR